MTALFFFSQRLSAQCDKLPFAYTINGCTVTFFSTDPTPLSPIYWDFGDGTTGSGDPVTHVYLSNGTFSVTASYTGFSGTYTCTQTFTLTGCNMTCCSAAFSGQVTRDCGALFLSLTSECSNGTHSWSVATVPAGECFTLVGFNSAMASQTVQLTNINTCTVTRLSITHTVDCAGGPYTVTQSVDINEDAIFIGRKNATTNLQDYNCVLPGASYSGACPAYVSGIVNTDKNFTFSGTDIHMDPGETGFDVPTGKTLELTQNAYVHGVSGNACNCLWRGIYVNGGELKFSATSVTSATVEDALYAVRVFESSTLGLKRVIFNKNFVSLRASDGDFLLTNNEQNEYDGTGPLKNICGLANLNDLAIMPYFGGAWATVPYSNERGYTGWYIRNLTAITLTPLSFPKYNHFRALSKGIEVYDTDVAMNANSYFSGIFPGTGYVVQGSAGVRFGDSGSNGTNTFSFRGIGNTNALPITDFDACAVGISLRSETQGTQIGVFQSNLVNVQTGIIIDAAGGSVSGTNPSSLYPGINTNTIRVSPAIFTPAYETAGIFMRDFDPGMSNLEINNNRITLNFEAPNGSSGIRALGAAGNIPLAYQLNIHRNSITVNQGRTGIFMDGYGSVSIHDNNPNSAPGAGIYMNWNVPLATTAGIQVNANLSVNNLIACNHIVSTATSVRNMVIANSPDNVIVKNYLNGPSTGAEFRLNCGMATDFRCNTMEDNIGNGLLYSVSAQTGPQGVPFTSSKGNKWIGAFTPGAAAATDGTVNVFNSRYYVRLVANENPSVNTMNWFFVNVPNGNEPDCLYNCPMGNQEAPPSKSISSLELLVAADSVEYDFFPEAYRWWNERNLYEKLYLNPDLANGQASLQAFMAVKNASSMAQLSQIAIKADSLCLPTAAQKNALDYNAQSLSGLLAQLSLVDSTLRDSAAQLTPQTWLESANERMSLLLQIDNLQAQNEALDSEIDQARLSGAPALIHQLESINPANIYETNEKTVLDFFLRYIIQGGEPDSASLAELSVIAGECIFEGGPAVDDARYLYASFTGILLPEAECAYGERRGRTNQSLFEQSGLTIYPNPADEQIFINLGGMAISESDDVQVSICNNLGQIVLRHQISLPESSIDISRLPAGTYQLRLEQDGKLIASRLMVVNR